MTVVTKKNGKRKTLNENFRAEIVKTILPAGMSERSKATKKRTGMALWQRNL
jgi:hypothetical protein